MKTLVVCPTRARPSRFMEMLGSFYETRSWPPAEDPGLQTYLYAYVAYDDPCYRAYKEMVPQRPGVMIEFGQRLTIVEVFNRAFRLFRSVHEYFVDCNDDFVFHTPAWDQKLMEAIEANGPVPDGPPVGCAYGRTLNLPSGAMFARRSLEALGWWFPPGFKHQFVDNVQRDLFAAAGQLYYVNDVWIEHKHPLLKVAGTAWDETYAHVYSQEVREHDECAYRRWKSDQACDDVERLMGA